MIESCCYYQSPIGKLVLHAEGDCLTEMFFENEKSVAVDKVACSNKHILPVLAASCEWLDRYFRGVNPGPVPPVLFRGSPFRMAVWKILQEIPYGRVMTYGEIARRLAAKKHISKMSAQAVGGAVGHNPVCILVPCHRVIGTHGALIGYGGGLDRKAKLLSLEGIDLKKLSSSDELYYMGK